MMEAWFSISEITASFSPNMVSNNPVFASKQLGYSIVSSLYKKEEIVFSRSL